MKILKLSTRSKVDKPTSPILSEENRRNFRLEFIAAHNDKIRKKKERLL